VSSTPALTADEVAKHTTLEDCWYIYNGNVYDVTQYLADSLHPAGNDVIVEYCGKDATEASGSSGAGGGVCTFVGAACNREPPRGCAACSMRCAARAAAAASSPQVSAHCRPCSAYFVHSTPAGHAPACCPTVQALGLMHSALRLRPFVVAQLCRHLTRCTAATRLAESRRAICWVRAERRKACLLGAVRALPLHAPHLPSLVHSPLLPCPTGPLA
jgi:hypothetical protein